MISQEQRKNTRARALFCADFVPKTRLIYETKHGMQTVVDSTRNEAHCWELLLWLLQPCKPSSLLEVAQSADFRRWNPWRKSDPPGIPNRRDVQNCPMVLHASMAQQLSGTKERMCACARNTLYHIIINQIQKVKRALPGREHSLCEFTANQEGVWLQIAWSILCTDCKKIKNEN